jgi:Tfp pilus assembly protein PilE
VLWLPLLGAAYSRARESTCDRHGLACAGSPEAAARSLAALSAGTRRWKNLDVAAYERQTSETAGFWMSFHELIAGYPWLTKRAARVLDVNGRLPRRNPFAYVLALFVPFAGRLGPGFATLILIYIVAVIAAIAIPAYQDYTMRALLTAAMIESAPARDALARYYEERRDVPESLEAAGIPDKLSNGVQLRLDPRRMVLTVVTPKGELVFTPAKSQEDRILWGCEAGQQTKPQHLPSDCRPLRRPEDR